VNWKVPGWAAAAGAVISVVAALAGGNPFGAILLRALVSALVAGALGLAAQYVLRRFLPDLGPSEAPAPPSVDILLDEEVPLAAQAREGQAAAEEPAAEELAAEELAAEELAAEEPAAAVESLGEEAGDGALDLGLDLGAEPGPAARRPAGRSPAGTSAPGYTPAEELAPEPFPELPEVEELGAPAEGGLAGRRPAPPGFTPTGRSARSPAPLPDVDELPDGALEALSAADSDSLASGTGEAAIPSRRALKAEELEAQLDSVTKGQDPASLAKAVRTFLRKDQEG
jgi:hypothetical protein